MESSLELHAQYPDKIAEWTSQCRLYIILVAYAAAAILGVLIGIHTSGRWEMNKRQNLTNRNLSLAVPMTGREQRKLYNF